MSEKEREEIGVDKYRKTEEHDFTGKETDEDSSLFFSFLSLSNFYHVKSSMILVI